VQNGHAPAPPDRALWNAEAEKGLLGSMILDNDAIPDVLPAVRAEDFFRDAHRAIFRAIRDLFEAGVGVDGLTLADELARRGELRDVGGDDYLADVLGSVPHAANAAHYADVVRQKAVARSLALLCDRVGRECRSGLRTADELAAALQAGLLEVHEPGSARRLVPIRDAVLDAMDRIGRRAGGEVDGISTGWPDLDDLLSGLQPEQLMIVAARPSMGKTAWALNLCDHAAATLRVPTLFVTLEMSEGALAERLLVARARVEGTRVRTGEHLDAAQLGRLRGAADALADAPVTFDSGDGQGMLSVLSAARGLALKGQAGLVILDYIQLVEGDPGESRDSRQEQVAKVGRRLKRLARELRVPVVALSQLNRASESREDRRPRMADLRESGSLEQDADVVLLLHRPEYYDPDDQPGVAELIVAKNRNGPTGTVRLAFRRELMKFASIADY
jgi:replicative DNA helicase